MHKFLLALSLTLIAGFAHAGCPVPNPNLLAPPFYDGCILPAAGLNNLSNTAGGINAIAVGTNNYTLALTGPSNTLVNPANGARFAFIVPNANTAQATIQSITNMTGGPWNIVMSDGLTLATGPGTLRKGALVALQYLTGIGFEIMSGQQNTNAIISTGTYTLEASTATLLTVDQGVNGGGITRWNSALGAYQMVDLAAAGAVEQELFNSTALYNTVANQSLGTGKLIGVFVEPSATTSPTTAKLSFYDFSGTYFFEDTGTTPSVPILTTSGTGDPTRVFLGIIYTNGSSISPVISPAASMGNFTYSHSHLDRWHFGYQTTPVTATTPSQTTAFQTLSTPSISAVTEGVTDAPRITAHVQITCTTNPHVETFRFLETFLIYNSSTPTTTAQQTYSVYAPVGQPVMITFDYMSAPPVSYITSQLQYMSDGSNSDCTFITDLLGDLPQ